MSYQSRLNDRYADVQKAQAAQDYANGNIQRFYESDAYQNGTASLADYTKMIDDYTNAANAAARAGRRYNRYARLHQSMAPTNQLPGPRPQPAADQVQEGPAKAEVAATQQNVPTFTKFYTPDEVAAAQQERENARIAQESAARAAEKAAADKAAADKVAQGQVAAEEPAAEQAAPGSTAV